MAIMNLLNVYFSGYHSAPVLEGRNWPDKKLSDKRFSVTQFFCRLLPVTSKTGATSARRHQAARDSIHQVWGAQAAGGEWRGLKGNSDLRRAVLFSRGPKVLKLRLFDA